MFISELSSILMKLSDNRMLMLVSSDGRVTALTTRTTTRGSCAVQYLTHELHILPQIL